MKVVSGKQMRKIEQIAIEKLGIPSILLMENAAGKIAKHCLAALKDNNNPIVTIICGPGNNGGDGLALARLLHAKEIKINVIFIGDINAVKGDAAVYMEIVKKLEIPLQVFSPSNNYHDNSYNGAASPHNQIEHESPTLLAKFHDNSYNGAASPHNQIEHESPTLLAEFHDNSLLCGLAAHLNRTRNGANKVGEFHDISNIISGSDLTVDAMLGTGLNRNVEKNFESMIELVNKHAKHIISVDIPSGIHSGTGQVMGGAVKAAQTVTLGLPKIGLYVYPGAAYAGKIHIEDISLPPALINKIDINAQILTDSEAKQMLPFRGQRSNKGSFGKIMVFAGSNEMPGAAALASSAVYMAGGGLVLACVLPNVAAVIHNTQREVVTRILKGENGLYCKQDIEAIIQEINNASVIVIGPGIGRAQNVSEFVHKLITMAQAPMILDADALFAVSEDVNILKTIKAPCIITPHPGEMSRLTGLAIADILGNPVNTALEFSREYNVVTLLKDAHTIIAAPNGNYYINTSGNNALAKAGTGDVLAGIIAGFIGQGSDVLTASALGAYIHGKSGEEAALHKSHYGVIAGDLLKYIPKVINNLTLKLARESVQRV